MRTESQDWCAYESAPGAQWDAKRPVCVVIEFRAFDPIEREWTISGLLGRGTFVTYARTVTILTTKLKPCLLPKGTADLQFCAETGRPGAEGVFPNMAAALQPQGNPFHRPMNLLLSSGRMLRGHFGGLGACGV